LRELSLITDDIAPLRGLTQLTYLSLEHSDEIEDISPLSELTNLEFLDLTGTRVTDFSPLKHLTHLEIVKSEVPESESDWSDSGSE
jgi:Leucine-rich repeat (LRR) protein